MGPSYFHRSVLNNTSDLIPYGTLSQPTTEEELLVAWAWWVAFFAVIHKNSISNVVFATPYLSFPRVGVAE